MKSEIAAFLEFRFEKISLIKSDDKKEIWRVKVKATGEDAVMKISKVGGAPYAQLKKISHPLLAKIFYCTSDGTVCVEEFIEGEFLSKMIEKKFFDEDTAENFLLQICDGLKVLHSENIIHRDIKPDNLILQTDGQIKLIDFDIARIFKADKQRDTKQFGTDGYAAPEQFGHSQTDSRSDIYALGKTLEEILGGENYHGRLEKIIAKCTEYDPKRRFQSVDEIKDALINIKVKPLENVIDYRAIEGVDVIKKVEVADKKSYGKIFIICAGIILLIGIFYFNSTDEEKIPAEITPSEEKILDTEKVETVEEKISDKKSPFAEINLPPPPNPTPIVTPPSAQVETPQINLPTDFKPSFPNQENTTLENFEPSFPEKKLVHAKYFFDGKHINDWQDNLVDDSEVAHLTYIPYEVWQNNSYPINGTLEVIIENLSSENFTPQLEITFDDDGNIQTKNLVGTILNSGQTQTFNIPLNQFRVDSLKGQLIGSAELHIKISGIAQIIGSNATFNFMFAQKGFPIINN